MHDTTRPCRSASDLLRSFNDPPVDGEHVVYRLATVRPGRSPEDDVEIVYVGVTSHFANRMRSHARKWWWQTVVPAACEFELFATRAAANAAEAQAIYELQPPMNRAGRLLVVGR